MPLRGVVPTSHVSDVLPDITHEALDAICGLQALAQLVEETKSVEREGVFQPLLKGARRLPIDLLKLGVEIGQPLFGGLVGRFLVCPLKFPTPRFRVVAPLRVGRLRGENRLKQLLNTPDLVGQLSSHRRRSGLPSPTWLSVQRTSKIDAQGFQRPRQVVHRVLPRSCSLVHRKLF